MCWPAVFSPVDTTHGWSTDRTSEKGMLFFMIQENNIGDFTESINIWIIQFAGTNVLWSK